MKKNCEFCKKPFKTCLALIKKGFGKFCSKFCYNKARIKDRISILCRICRKKLYLIPSKARITRYCSMNCYLIGRKEDIDKGVITPTRNFSNKSTTGRFDEEANHWRGNRVGYRGLHIWVKKHLGQPDTCEHCGRSNLSGHLIHWANKSGEYKRNLEDWLRLCVQCHKNYDHAHIS